jgi:sugar lactone lactonase YvrE
MRTLTVLAVLVLAVPAHADLMVASRGGSQVLRYTDAGAPVGVFAAHPDLVRPVGITYGPDGHLYVSVGDTDRVMRFDGATGASLGVFTQGGGFVSPRNLNFGPDGALYVADGTQSRILRFDGATGAFDRVLVEGGALNGPTSFTFGPDGNLYVVSVLSHRVLRYDGTTGAPLGEFVTTGLQLPHDVSFGPDGNLYVTNSQSGLVQRYRASDGTFLDTFVRDAALRQPLGMTWGPDGHLYVANQGGNEVRRYDGTTGGFAGVVVAAGAGGLSMPAFLAFTPAGAVSMAATAVGGQPRVRLVASGARPGARVLVVEGTTAGAGSLAECPGTDLGLGDPQALAGRVADESGNVVVEMQSSSPGSTALFVALDAARCQASAPAPLTLP